MLAIREFPVVDRRLQPYVEAYGLLQLRSTTIHEKELLPWPGCFLLFVDQAFAVDDQAFRGGCVLGMQENARRLRWYDDELTVFTVRFAPYGLRPFLRVPVPSLTAKASDAPGVFHLPLPSLFETVRSAATPDAWVRAVEDYLLANLVDDRKDEMDWHVMRLATAIKREPSLPLGPAREAIPLSDRQFARRFKAHVGVSLRTYVKICRFAYAKTSLLQSAPSSLTAVGYDAGYFDQAHFTHDFKKLAEGSPKLFPGQYPLHRLIFKLDN